LKPELKTLGSYRTAKAFDELFPILTAYKKITGHKTHLFYQDIEEDKTWIVERDGYYKANALSYAMILAIKAAGLEVKEPARALRRWYSTEFSIKHGAAAESQSAGHTEETATVHYIDQEAAAKAKPLGKAK
jgi:hypothetical protein